MSGPKLAKVAPCAHAVPWPVSTIGTTCEGTDVFGEIWMIRSRPGRIVNPPANVTTSDPEVTVTDRGPVAAPWAIVIGTDKVAGPFTVTAPKVTPPPLKDT